MTRSLFTAAFMLLCATSHASAHHAFAAEYDETKTIIVSGKVSSTKWTNPHVWIYMNGKDETGKSANWGFEMGSPNGLKNRGWKAMELKKGDQITIDGYRAKTGKNIANARTVTMPDGRKLFGGFQSTPRGSGK